MGHFATIRSVQVVGIGARIVDVEVDVVKNTLHKFSVVGLPDKAVEESKDRIAAALKNSGFPSPKQANQKITISLAPANLKKEGPAFDLPMAIGYLFALGDIDTSVSDSVFVGELSLDGTVRGVRGILALVQEAKKAGYKKIYVPFENRNEAAVISDITIYAVCTLRDVVDHLRTEKLLNPIENGVSRSQTESLSLDFSDVVGQESAKRGLEIAAAGGHNIALYGPPGTGKSMLARVFAGILPDLSEEEALEVTAIHSVAGALENDLMVSPPFRSPHHTASYVSMVGGGTYPRPGEVTLAHKGVLFMDEFPEFDRRVIETLRQPLEDGVISISRAKGSEQFPANFILVAALNPCPCGFRTSNVKQCTCSPIQIERYRKKISGPIIDRIDMWVDVAEVEHNKLSKGSDGEKSDVRRQRVEAARERQRKRFGKESMKNSDMNVRDIRKHIKIDEELQKLFDDTAKAYQLSARAYHRVLKLSRTIADLEGSDDILQDHLLEAVQYRPKELM